LLYVFQGELQDKDLHTIEDKSVGPGRAVALKHFCDELLEALDRFVDLA